MTARVYTMRDLGQNAGRIMTEVQESGKPAFITRHGQYIAVITPLAPGQVESRVLALIERELAGEAPQ